MTNTKKLKEKIEEKGFKYSFLAYACGITPRTFYNKVHGKAKFVQDEILILKTLLNLSEKEIDLIFFANKGEDSSPSKG